MKTENNEITVSGLEQVQKEQDEKTERGKNLITDIAMSCSNDYTVIDSLMEILELFSIKDSSVMIGDMAEDLQRYLFTWTKEHGDGISQWKESVLSGKKYQTTPGESLETRDAPKYSDEFYFNQMAERLVAILEHPEVPEQTKDALLGIADNTIQESGIDSDTSYYIRTKFPKAMFALEGEYSKAVMHNLKVVMENAIPDEIYSPILKKNLNR